MGARELKRVQRLVAPVVSSNAVTGSRSWGFWRAIRGLLSLPVAALGAALCVPWRLYRCLCQLSRPWTLATAGCLGGRLSLVALFVRFGVVG